MAGGVRGTLLALRTITSTVVTIHHVHGRKGSTHHSPLCNHACRRAANNLVTGLECRQGLHGKPRLRKWPALRGPVSAAAGATDPGQVLCSGGRDAAAWADVGGAILHLIPSSLHAQLPLHCSSGSANCGKYMTRMRMRQHSKFIGCRVPKCIVGSKIGHTCESAGASRAHMESRAGGGPAGCSSFSDAGRGALTRRMHETGVGATAVRACPQINGGSAAASN